MGFDRHRTQLLARTCALGATLFCASATAAAGNFWALASLLFLFSGWQALALYRHVNQRSERCAELLAALRQGDGSQDFYASLMAAGELQLAQEFKSTSQQLASQRRQQLHDLRYAQHLISNSPMPLLSVDDQGRVQLHNRAARKLLPGARSLADLNALGGSFADSIAHLSPGKRQLVTFSDATGQRQLMAQASELTHAKGRETLISLLDIQRELDAAQLNAWQELVSVLTHEMMNSLTPISSLAHTAQDLAQGLTASQSTAQVAGSDLEDLQEAIEALARRAEGLSAFIQSYRSLSSLPEPRCRDVLLAPLVDRCAQLINTPVAVEISADLRVYCDQHLLEQVFINLLQNAEQALTGSSESSADKAPERQGSKRPLISVSAAAHGDNRVEIHLADSGPGIDDDKLRSIFLPFYTTKSHGAGIGLALVRQIINAHGGDIQAGRAPEGGALFRFSLAAAG